MKGPSWWNNSDSKQFRKIVLQVSPCYIYEILPTHHIDLLDKCPTYHTENKNTFIFYFYTSALDTLEGLIYGILRVKKSKFKWIILILIGNYEVCAYYRAYVIVKSTNLTSRGYRSCTPCVFYNAMGYTPKDVLFNGVVPD